jgi:hypothetical protein
MKYIKTYEGYRVFDKKNIGDIVQCYFTPSYGYHNLGVGRKYEIVDTRSSGQFYEIKVKPIEYDPLINDDRFDRYYLEVYFMNPEERIKLIKFNKKVDKYNI